MDRLTTLITGASSGIGKNLVFSLGEQFKERNLILASRNIKELNQIKKQVIELNPSFVIETIKCDMKDEASVERLIKKSYTRFKRIDHFILNAGVSMWIDFKNIQKIGIIKEIMEVNYLGVVYPLHFAFKKILEQKTTIIVVSSAQSFIPLPYHSGYVASKYATNGFLDTLRQELKQEVKDINIVELMLGWVRGTSLRANALGKLESRKLNSSEKKTTPNPNYKKEDLKAPKGRKSLFACEVRECVEKLIEIMHSPTNKSGQIYLPKIIALIPWVKIFFPRLLYQIIRKITNKE